MGTICCKQKAQEKDIPDVEVQANNNKCCFDETYDCHSSCCVTIVAKPDTPRPKKEHPPRSITM